MSFIISKEGVMSRKYLSGLFRKKIFLILCLCPSVYGQIQLSAGHSFYITKTSLEGQLNQYTNIGVQAEQYGHQKHWFYGGYGKALFFIDSSNQNYISVPDLFAGYELDIDKYQFNLVLGRQKRSKNFLYQEEKRASEKSALIFPEPWSFMDEVWGLGLWQSQIQWDHFLIEEQGLPGIFFTIQREQLSLTVFLSGLFIPNSTAVVEVTPKGEIYSKSRWFSPLQSDFMAFNQRIESLYWIQQPYLKSVLLNDTLAFRLRFGDMNKHWFNLAYAYKPINEIYFKIDSKFAIHETAVSNSIHYHLFNHSLVSIDLGFKNTWLTSVLSVTQETPYPSKVPEDWLAVSLPNGLFLSAHFQWSMKQHPWILDHIELNFLYSHFLHKAVDSSNQLGLSLSTWRFRLHKGFSVFAETKPVEWGRQAFSLKTGYWYSVDERGGWINAELIWRITSQLLVTARLDILGAEDHEKESFFNTYRHNDRIAARLIYVIE